MIEIHSEKYRNLKLCASSVIVRELITLNAHISKDTHFSKKKTIIIISFLPLKMHKEIIIIFKCVHRTGEIPFFFFF